ncbi:hypothetical protein C8J57DRAFT_1408270 [Mycena rebaudengoi]|nr:hypothetical protein C8J57DRAFT_1408270 [Mycena rebaudengoi]
MAIRSITISRYPDLPTFSNVLRAAAILPSLGTVHGRDVVINHLELAAIHAGFTCRPREPKAGHALDGGVGCTYVAGDLAYAPHHSPRQYCLAPPVAEGRSHLFLLVHWRSHLIIAHLPINIGLLGSFTLQYIFADLRSAGAEGPRQAPHCVHTDHNGPCAWVQELHLCAASVRAGCYRHSRPFCSRMFHSRAAGLSVLKGLVPACSGRRESDIAALPLAGMDNTFQATATSRGCCTAVDDHCI